MTPTHVTKNLAEESGPAASEPIVYWHRQLPPFDTELLGEHVLEATSGRSRLHSRTETSCGIAVIAI